MRSHTVSSVYLSYLSTHHACPICLPVRSHLLTLSHQTPQHPITSTTGCALLFLLLPALPPTKSSRPSTSLFRSPNIYCLNIHLPSRRISERVTPSTKD